MPTYHPDTRYLTDYVAGTLPLALSITVKAHCELCSDCRRQVRDLEQLAGQMFDSEIQPETLPADMLASVMARLDETPEAPKPTVKETLAVDDTTVQMPKVVQKLTQGSLDKISWRNIGKRLRYSRLSTGDKNVELGLYDINAGAKIPHHKHQSDEVTLVLKGSFSDVDGIYKEGDFIVRSPGEKHQPIASQDENCICLSAIEKPIRFTGLMRLFNGFLKVNPA